MTVTQQIGIQSWYAEQQLQLGIPLTPREVALFCLYRKLQRHVYIIDPPGEVNVGDRMPWGQPREQIEIVAAVPDEPGKWFACVVEE